MKCCRGCFEDFPAEDVNAGGFCADCQERIDWILKTEQAEEGRR